MEHSPGALVRDVLVVLTWGALAVLAGAVAWSAVARLGQSGGSLSSEGALRQDQVLRALAHTATPPSATPSRGRAPRPSGRTVTRTWQVVGGTVAATCRGPSVELMYAAPSDGWGYRRESAPRQLLAVEFLRPGRRSHLVVRCSGGAPVRAVNAVESTHSVSDGEGSGD